MMETGGTWGAPAQGISSVFYLRLFYLSPLIFRLAYLGEQVSSKVGYSSQSCKPVSKGWFIFVRKYGRLDVDFPSPAHDVSESWGPALPGQKVHDMVGLVHFTGIESSKLGRSWHSHLQRRTGRGGQCKGHRLRVGHRPVSGYEWLPRPCPPETSKGRSVKIRRQRLMLSGQDGGRDSPGHC